MKERWLKIKQYFTQDKEIFAKGLCGKKLFIIFVIASIFGTYYEQILNLIKYYIQDGIIFWEIRRGVFYGPFSPVYGMGAVILCYLLLRKKRPDWQIFLYGSLLGGCFEYLISLLQEIFTGTTSWDYSNHFLNIDGRTTIPFMFFWGVLSFLLVRGIYPWLSKQIEKIPKRLGEVLFVFVLVLLCLDMLVSWTALIRGALRRENIPPITPVGKMYDEVYPDPYLERAFPNMDFKR